MHRSDRSQLSVSCRGGWEPEERHRLPLGPTKQHPVNLVTAIKHDMAGDSMVAGIGPALARGETLREPARFGIAVGAAHKDG